MTLYHLPPQRAVCNSGGMQALPVNRPCAWAPCWQPRAPLHACGQVWGCRPPTPQPGAAHSAKGKHRHRELSGVMYTFHLGENHKHVDVHDSLLLWR